MKSSMFCAPEIFLNLFFLSFLSTIDLSAKADQLQFKTDKLTIDFGGKCNNEIYFSNSMSYLNSSLGNDSLFYVRSTFDFYSTFFQGDYETPRIVFYDTLRFRFKWGSQTDVKNSDTFVNVANTRFTVKGTATNKHLLWMRESWLKLRLGSLGEHNNYFQIGLINYQVGRGISLGAAYDATGFLGFVPGSSIDQYAPAMLFSFNPIADRYVIDLYAALVENKQTSLTDNFEKIRDNELNACSERGTSRQSYIVALRNEVCVYKKDEEKVVFEPYFVHQHAPDQDLEFTNDVDSYLTTAGAALEATGNRFSWGIEGACNFGEIEVKPWDRNYTKITKDDSGFLIEQYTKVYTQDPATVKKPTSATYTKDIAALLSGSPKNRSMNGKKVGTVSSVDIYNAFDRFRPEQRRILGGYFFVADVEYACIPKVLSCAVGVGYASGYIDQQQDTNTMSTQALMNERYSGFLPLQSVYSGKRLRHLVIFNQGVPRFNVRLPNADLSRKNVTAVLESDVVNEMTNIAFVGTRFDWKVQAFKKYGLNVAQNVICYWAPVTAHTSKTVTLADATTELQAKDHSHNFLGTEFTTEISMLFYEKVKIAGYFGALIPGNHYKDMCGTKIGKNSQPTGHDIGYVGNIGVAYFF